MLMQAAGIGLGHNIRWGARAFMLRPILALNFFKQGFFYGCVMFGFYTVQITWFCFGVGVRRGDIRNGLCALVSGIAAFLYRGGLQNAVERTGFGCFRGTGFLSEAVT